MVITWYGQNCFKIQSGDTVIITDPYSKETGLPAPRFRADIVIKSHCHSHLQSESIPDNPFVVDGPGEYEIKGVRIRGVETHHDSVSGKERGLNTAYIIEIEGMILCHLGDFGEEKIRGETLEAIGTIDMLFVPIGGRLVINSKEASKIIQEIEPRIVIPMGYKIPGLKISADPIEPFLKEMGIRSSHEEERLTIKKKDIPQTEETRVIILKVA